MEFKEKSVDLKVACPLCGLARPDQDAAEKDEHLCCCEANEAEGDADKSPELTEQKAGDAPIAPVESEYDDENDSAGLAGDTLIKDDFQVISRLGQGCVTDSYLVRNKALKRKFVLKVLKESYDKNPRTSKRFRLAASKAVQLNHPNIVTVYEVDQNKDGTSYAVSEYIESATLADVIKREGFLDTQEVVEVAMQVCEALQFAHENKIVHRGVKPSNIFLVNRKSGKYSAKLSDFGTTVALPNAGRETQFRPADIREFGDPRYMSPEQCVGEKLSPTSDVYSLGCTMYEALCGKTPFASKNPMTTAIKQMSEDVRLMSLRFKDLDIPEDLEAIVIRALAKDPRKRYQSAAEMMNDLQRFSKHKPTSKPFEPFLAFKKMLSRTKDWLSEESDLRRLHATTATLLTVAVILGLICIWFLYAINPEDLNAAAGRTLKSVASGFNWKTPDGEFSTGIGSLLVPKVVTLKDNNGNILYSSTAPSVRMAVEEALHRRVRLAGIDLHGENLAALAADEADFTGANFDGALMFGCSLERAKLGKANFAGASLNGANLAQATAPWASFISSNMRGANLTGGDFAASDFSLSQMTGVNLAHTNLSNCNFSAARVLRSNFEAANMSNVTLTDAKFAACNFAGVAKDGLSMEQETGHMDKGRPSVVVSDHVF